MEYTTSVHLDQPVRIGLACSEWTNITSTSSDSLGHVNWGLGDSALRPAHTARVVGDDIHVLDLAGSGAIVGPQWFIERTEDISVDALLQPARLLEIAGDHGGRITGPVDLAFLGDYTDAPPDEQLLISHDIDDALAVAALCPPDDSTTADLGNRTRWFTALTDSTEVLGCAAYSEFQGFVADLTTLTAPAHRRHGIGCAVTLLAAEDALDSGLIPQLRTSRGQCDRSDAST